MSKLANIIDGWKNVIFENKEAETAAKKRAVFCSSCKYNIHNKCNLCGCPLIAKLRSMKKDNKCLIGKW